MMRSVSRKTTLVAFSVLWVIFGGAYLGAQQPGKPKDLTPLVRPQALCTMFNNNAGISPNSGLQQISSILNVRGFQVDSVNWLDGELQASHKDSAGSDIDRVIVWLERDFQKPTERLKVFLLYGRFEKFFGSTEVSRVLVDSTFEAQHIGSVKQDIITHCLSGGNQ